MQDRHQILSSVFLLIYVRRLSRTVVARRCLIWSSFVSLLAEFAVVDTAAVGALL
jgi:hypothetical protein